MKLPYSLDRGNSFLLAGGSAPIRKILSILECVADIDSPVLFEGEIGVGKQMLARALHDRSGRSSCPFETIQCSALPPELLEVELFGHGSPQDGLFARSRGGSVHIAEIHQMPMRIQAMLNDFLEQAKASSFTPHNGSGYNFRLVTSTTANLEDLIEEGKFRQDLYYKISVIPINVPPLLERREDIALLVEQFLAEQAGRSGQGKKSMGSFAGEFLESYPWPGNISELRNAVERACALAEGDSIRPGDLPVKVTRSSECLPEAAGANPPSLPIGSTLDEFISSQEKLFISATLKFNNLSRERTAGMLGVSVATLYRKMGISLERKQLRRVALQAV